MFATNIEKLKILKYHMFKKNIRSFAVTVVMNIKICLKKKNQLKY